MKFAIAGIGALLLIIGVYFAMSISYTNTHMRNVNLGKAQIQVIEAVYDKMWKTLKTNAGITEKSKDAFKEIYVGLMEGRYSHGSGQMMNWIKEQNPDYKPQADMYKKLMTSVESLRAEFFEAQKYMISIQNQDNNLFDTQPSNWFVKDKLKGGTFDRIKYTVISSTKSKAVMESGMEDDIDIFK